MQAGPGGSTSRNTWSAIRLKLLQQPEDCDTELKESSRPQDASDPSLLELYEIWLKKKKLQSTKHRWHQAASLLNNNVRHKQQDFPGFPTLDVVPWHSDRATITFLVVWQM